MNGVLSWIKRDAELIGGKGERTGWLGGVKRGVKWVGHDAMGEGGRWG